MESIGNLISRIIRHQGVKRVSLVIQINLRRAVESRFVHTHSIPGQTAFNGNFGTK